MPGVFAWLSYLCRLWLPYYKFTVEKNRLNRLVAFTVEPLFVQSVAWQSADWQWASVWDSGSYRTGGSRKKSWKFKINCSLAGKVRKIETGLWNAGKVREKSLKIDPVSDYFENRKLVLITPGCRSMHGLAAGIRPSESARTRRICCWNVSRCFV